MFPSLVFVAVDRIGDVHGPASIVGAIITPHRTVRQVHNCLKFL